MKVKGSPTKYPGVFRISNKVYRIRGKVRDPRTGKNKEVDRILDDVTELKAANLRAELLEDLRLGQAPQSQKRLRVGEFAQSWMKSKALKIEPDTARKYAEHLDKHILPALGDYYFDALTKRDVQEWVDRCLTSQYESRAKDASKRTRRTYAIRTVGKWFDLLRNITRDAIDDLRLERDPTLRIEFPADPSSRGRKSLDRYELERFLAVMRERYPQHFALTVVLVATGLRFCHATALKWDDWDEELGVVRVQRKQIRGVVGAVNSRKRAPELLVIEPMVATILREHRVALIRNQNPGLHEGWMFPAPCGRLRAHHSPVAGIWKKCAAAAGIGRRFTIHGSRYTFTDLSRRAKIDPIVRRGMVGHATERMQDHYSHIDIEEQRAAMRAVVQLIPLPGGDGGGDAPGTKPEPAAAKESNKK